MKTKIQSLMTRFLEGKTNNNNKTTKILSSDLTLKTMNHEDYGNPEISNFNNISDVGLDRRAEKSTTENCLKDVSFLTIYYNNVRCITNKTNICTKIDLSIYKVLILTETWMSINESSSVYFPKQFNVYRLDRPRMARRSGGVAILVHAEIGNRQLKLIGDETCEFVVVELQSKPVPLIIYAVYMRKFDLEVANKHVEMIKQMVLEYPRHRIMVVGDFNIDSVRWVADEFNSYYLPVGGSSSVNEFLKKMHEMSFYQLSNVKNKYGNVLDLVYISELGDVDMQVDKSKLIEEVQQDPAHVPYEIVFEYCKAATTNIVMKEIICYKLGNYERLNQQIDGINFQHEINNRDIESAFEFVSSKITELVTNNVPKRMIRVNVNKPVWWNKDLQKLKNRRDKLFKRSKKGLEISEYERVLNEFDDLTSKSYQRYIDEVQANMKMNPTEFWKFAKLRNKQSSYPVDMYWGNKVGNTHDQIVELFADFFESNYVMDDQHWDFDDVYCIPETYSEVEVSLFDIERAIYALKWRGGVGPDGLSPYVFKMCVESLVWPLWLLFKKTFDSKYIPEKMKLSRVVPVFKKGTKKNIENYRVIVINSVILNIFQRAVKFKLSSIIEPYLSKAQHGFRTKRSVTTNLLATSVMAHEAFERGVQLDNFYGDYRSAFDRIFHRLLIGKFARFSIGPKTARWLYSCLSNMKYYVQIGNSKSRIYIAASGIIPGSALGPPLFLIFINDIEEVVVHAMLRLFADDIKLSMIINDLADCEKLQSDINKVMEWNETNRLLFRNEKCAIFTAYRKTSCIKAKYKLGEFEIERCEEIRDLGILVDSKFTFAHHIEQLTSHARQIIGYIKRISDGKFEIETLRLLYLAYVRSKMEFASVIWSPYQSVYIDDIESIQKQFMIDLLDIRRNATSYRLAPYIERCRKLKLQPLYWRREVADTMLAYDLYVGYVNDDFLKSKFKGSRSNREFRANRLLETRVYGANYLTNQPIARLVNIVNELSYIIVKSRWRGEFKMRMLQMKDEQLNCNL